MRKAEIYFKDNLAGILTETESSNQAIIWPSSAK